MSNNPFKYAGNANSAASLSKKAKKHNQSLYAVAERTVDSAIGALKKFGSGFIVDYGDVQYLLRVEVDIDGNALAWVEYAADDEGTKRQESSGSDAHLLATAFATFHPNACFMYAKEGHAPNPILLYGAEKHETCNHLSTNNLKKLLDADITNFSIACSTEIKR